VTVIKRFRLLHQFIPPVPPINLTVRVLIPSHWMRKFAARILALTSGKERVFGA